MAAEKQVIATEKRQDMGKVGAGMALNYLGNKSRISRRRPKLVKTGPIWSKMAQIGLWLRDRLAGYAIYHAGRKAAYRAFYFMGLQGQQ